MSGTLAERIHTAVAGFRQDTAAMLLSYDDLPAAVMARVEGQAAAIAADALQLAETIADAEDLGRSLALLWCELKGAWVRHNLVMQYQLAASGEPDPAVWLNGSVISGLLGALEPLIPLDALERLDGVLSDPLNIARPDAVVLAQLREQHQRNGRLVRTISEELNALFRAVLDVRDRLMVSGRGAPGADPQALLQTLVGRVEASFSLLRTHLRQDSRTPWATLWPTLQGELLTQADQLNLRCQVADASDPTAAVDAQQVEPLLAGWFAAAAFLIAGLATESAEQRQARDRSLHPHLDVRCQTGPDGGRLILTDDGPGLNPDTFPPEVAAAWHRLCAAGRAGGMAVDHRGIPGAGTTLTLSWEPFRYQQTELLMIVRRHGHLYALPAAAIGRVVPAPATAVHHTPLGHTFRSPQGFYPWQDLPRGDGSATGEGTLPALAVLCEEAGRRVAIGVDATERLHATIIEPLRTAAFAPPPYLRGVVRYGGALCLVIDPWQLPSLSEVPHVPAAG